MTRSLKRLCRGAPRQRGGTTVRRGGRDRSQARPSDGVPGGEVLADDVDFSEGERPVVPHDFGDVAVQELGESPFRTDPPVGPSVERADGTGATRDTGHERKRDPRRVVAHTDRLERCRAHRCGASHRDRHVLLIEPRVVRREEPFGVPRSRRGPGAKNVHTPCR